MRPWRHSLLLIALPLLSGCLTPLARKAIEVAGRPRRIEEPSQVVRLERVACRSGTLYVDASYGQGKIRQFRVRPLPEDPRADPPPLIEIADASFPEEAIEIPIHWEGHPATPRCARLAGGALELREGSALRRVATFPRAGRTRYAPRETLSYVKQCLWVVFGLPAAALGDLAIGAALVAGFGFGLVGGALNGR